MLYLVSRNRVRIFTHKLINIIMSGNTKFFNRVLCIQNYYDIYNEVYFYRFWVLGFYFDTDKNSL
jgi:hypothetical protein